MTLELRDYAPADREAVAQIWHEAWQTSGLATATDPTIADYCARIDAESCDWSIRVACAESVIVGFAALHRSESRLRQLFVLPARQRTGVGTRLLDDARCLMPDGFWLRTDRDNGTARRFYEARGLRLTGEAAHPDGGHPIAVYRWP